jgi:2-iminobutanoate/2-iminopropanoate deaminase
MVKPKPDISCAKKTGHFDLLTTELCNLTSQNTPHAVILRGMEIKRINTPNAPQPAGHYSQATVYNGLVFVAGQLSIDPSGEKRLGSIEEQTELALSNVHAILQAAGSDWDRVLKMNISVSDINLWEAVNKVYARVLGENRPARAVIPCGPLHYGFLIEIEAIAATDM